MKRAAAFAVAMALALPAAAETWFEAYDRGVKAVNAKQYQAGSDALQRAISEMPVENTAVRTRTQIITYVPHFFLGIARFNLGDVDGAMREWKMSQEQGAIQNTQYLAAFQDWVARANVEKQRIAQNGASESKKAADVALSRALTGQMEAVSASGDSTDKYRIGKIKLKDALEQFNKAGTDVSAYNRVTQLATEARGLFAAAAAEAKKPAAPPPPPLPKTVTVAEPVAESEARVTARVALQKFRQRLMMMSADPQYASVLSDLSREAAAADAMEHRLASENDEAALKEMTQEVAARDREVTVLLGRAAANAAKLSEEESTKSQLEAAYRAYASGNLAVSEDLLTNILTRTPSPEAYLLRGCTRYTRAMLSKQPDDLLVGARLDFREALKINPALRLDARMFSPKLVRFFEDVLSGAPVSSPAPHP